MTCVHCGQPVALAPVTRDVIPYPERWAHLTRVSRHGWRDRPAFVTCPTGNTVAAPRSTS